MLEDGEELAVVSRTLTMPTYPRRRTSTPTLRPECWNARLPEWTQSSDPGARPRADGGSNGGIRANETPSRATGGLFRARIGGRRGAIRTLDLLNPISAARSHAVQIRGDAASAARHSV